MTINIIKKNIEEESNRPNSQKTKIKIKKKQNKIYRNINIYKILFCKKHDIYTYLRQFKWIRKLHLYLKNIV